MPRLTRRRYVALASAITPPIAGCISGGDDSPPDSPAESPTPTATPTATDTPTETGTATETSTPTPTPIETTSESNKTVVEATGNNEFVPHRVTIATGETVTWENTASGYYDDHTVTSAQFHETAEAWSLNEEFGGGETISYTFDTEGVYEYFCSIHGKDTMCGAVLVGDVSLDTSLPCE